MDGSLWVLVSRFVGKKTVDTLVDGVIHLNLMYSSGDIYDMSLLLGFFLVASDNSYAPYEIISIAENGIEQKDHNLRITSPMLLHDTAVIPATNVKALRSNILIQPAPHQEMNLLRMKETKERRNRKETIAAY